MKKLPCNYKDCGLRRKHWCEPNVPRGTQYVEVKDNYNGPVYCSFEYAILDGAYSLKDGWLIR